MRNFSTLLNKLYLFLGLISPLYLFIQLFESTSIKYVRLLFITLQDMQCS